MTQETQTDTDYNVHSVALADTLVKFGFEQVDTLNDVQVILERRNSYGSTFVSVDYDNGKVVIKGVNLQGRTTRTEQLTMTATDHVEKAARKVLSFG